MTIVLRGIYAPITTPFTDGGDVDRAALAANVTAHLERGLAGIVVAGTTGEAPLLDEREREQLVQWTRPLVTGGQLLIAGTGAESTRATVRLTRAAADNGADAVLVVAPHYFGSSMSSEALRAHYLRVADQSRIPVILYNIPKYMHFRFSRDLVVELAKHPNIAGIKDSSGDPASFEEYLTAQGEGFTTMTGNGQFWGRALQMGARAGILAVSQFAPELSLAVYEAMSRKDFAAGEAFQSRLSPLAKEIVGDMGIAGVKAALDVVGLRGGPTRAPLLPLGRAQLDRVRQLVRDAELPVAA